MVDFVTITPEAVAFFKQSLGCNKGVRIDIVSGGCQGMTYKVDFVTNGDPADVCVEKDGIKFYFASKSVLFVAGMTMDYKVTPLGGNIVFENPNARSKCNCGKSFCVDDNVACNSESCSSRSCC